MYKHHFPILLAILIVLAAGCAKTSKQIKIPRDAAKMDVEFSWEGIQPCTHESPEIRVTNIPDKTIIFRVQLKNITIPVWNQGGGSVKHDGLIPAGALQIGYNGPCPPPGKRQKYEFSVMAINAENEIIGFGKVRHPFPPKK